MKNKQRLRVGYVSGPESYPLIIADRLGLSDRYGLDLELLECLGLSSLSQKMARGLIDVSIRDSVEAYLHKNSTGTNDLVAGALIRGARNHVMVSGRIRRMGGVDVQSLGLLFRNRNVEKPLRIAVAEPMSSTECYRLEFARSAGRGWTERVILPSEVMEESLSSEMIDGYCCGLQVTQGLSQKKTGVIISGLKAVPNRRECALVAERGFLEQNRGSYCALLAAILDGQDKLAVESHLDANVDLIPAENEYGVGTVRAAISDIYLKNKVKSSNDPGVWGSAMTGGIVRPSPQWETVTSERCRRLGIVSATAKKSSFMDHALYDRAIAMRS